MIVAEKMQHAMDRQMTEVIGQSPCPGPSASRGADAMEARAMSPSRSRALGGAGSGQHIGGQSILAAKPGGEVADVGVVGEQDDQVAFVGGVGVAQGRDDGGVGGEFDDFRGVGQGPGPGLTSPISTSIIFWPAPEPFFFFFLVSAS